MARLVEALRVHVLHEDVLDAEDRLEDRGDSAMLVVGPLVALVVRVENEDAVAGRRVGPGGGGSRGNGAGGRPEKERERGEESAKPHSDPGMEASRPLRKLQTTEAHGSRIT